MSDCVRLLTMLPPYGAFVGQKSLGRGIAVSLEAHVFDDAWVGIGVRERTCSRDLAAGNQAEAAGNAANEIHVLLHQQNCCPGFAMIGPENCADPVQCFRLEPLADFIEKDEPRVIYPRLYGLGWVAPNFSRRVALDYGPPPIS